MNVFRYVKRGRCGCGFYWTTPSSSNIICKCGASGFEQSIEFGGGVAFTEEEFVAACAAEVGIAVENVRVEEVA